MLLSAILLYFSAVNFVQHNKYPVTIAVSTTPLSTPFYVAQSIDAFDKTCVDVSIEPVIGGHAAFAKVIDGEVDFGTSSDSVIAFQSLSNKAFVTHAMFVQSSNDVKLISLSEENITSFAQLKGKRVGVTKGTASEYFLSTLLALEGLSIDDIILSHYKPEQLTLALANHQVDAIAPWEPFAFQTKRKLGDTVTVHDTKNINTLSFNLISQTADAKLIEKTKCVLEGINIAIDYISSHPTHAQALITKELNLEPAFIDWVWPDYIFKTGLNQALYLNIKSQAVWAIETQMVSYSQLPNFNHFIDNRALLQVEPLAVSSYIN